MKKLKKFKLPVVAIIIIILFPLLASAQEDDSLIIPVYSGSDIRYDDQIGFEEFSFIINETTVQNTEGVLRRFFCRAPEMFILLSLQTLEPGQQMKITEHFIFASNSTEQGRAINRCVEIVEQ